MRTKFVISVILSIMSIYVSAQTQSAHDLMQQFRYKEAVELLKTQPETIENLLLKAESYEKLYNFSDALAVYEQLLQSNPNDVELIVSTAECASQAVDAEQSLKYWIKADSLSPGNLFFQTKKAMAYYRNGNWQETIESAQTVFQSDSIPLLLRMTGDAFQNLSDPIWANYYYTKAYEKNPSDHLSLSRICEYFYAMEEDGYDTVLVMTEKYLNEINPNQKTIGQMNGMANYAVKNYEEATDRLKKNVELGDTSFSTNYYLGMSFYRRELYDEATDWLAKAYEQKDSDINLLYYYGTSLSHTYDIEKGIAVLQEGIGKIEEISALIFDFEHSSADAYQRLGNYPKAIEYYKSSLKRQPEEYQLLYSIAYSYEMMKDYKNAIVFYEQLLKTAPADIDIASLAFAKEEKMTTKNFYYIVSFRRIKELQEKMFMQSGKKQP